MNETARKMRKIVDELISFFFQVGSNDVQLDMKRFDNGYRLTVESDYDPAHTKRVQDLDRFLNVEEKYDGWEEGYWELAGVSGQESELPLIGQMLDEAEIEIGESHVRLVLIKYFAKARP